VDRGNEEGRAQGNPKSDSGKGEGAAREIDPPYLGTVARGDESSVNFRGTRGSANLLRAAYFGELPFYEVG
jgi:hypothetical protein